MARFTFRLFLFGVAAGLAAVAQSAGPLWIVQSNDVDPTEPSSQVEGRWYHWLGVDPVVTHLETGIAIDAGPFAGRTQRIAVRQRAPISRLEVKVKRIGRPGPLCWEIGSAWGKNDLGTGHVPPEQVNVNFEHFVSMGMRPTAGGELYVRLRAASGRCPDDYYAVYCVWASPHAEKAKVNGYRGPTEVGMMYRILRPDAAGAALEPDGTPMAEGPSMITRLLSEQPGPGGRPLAADEEEPYDFVDQLVAGHDPRCDGLPWPGVRAEPGEIVIDDRWQIVVAAPKSAPACTAVEDLRQFLGQHMRLDLPVRWDQSAKGGEGRTIFISQGPGAKDGPARPAGYRFTAAGERVGLHGYDGRGVLRAVWYLEDLLRLRGVAVLEPEARTREPRYTPRATCAAWAGEGELATPAPVYTDEHLALISHYGYDAIWLGWYPGPERRDRLPTEIEPGRTPEGTTSRPFTARLRELTERAERYDLEVVIQYCAPHPADEAQRQAVAEEARQFLREVPKIKTVVVLDEGMGSVTKGIAAWSESCSLVARAMLEVRPGMNVVAWRYTFRSRVADRCDWDKRMEQFATIDPRVAYMGNFDTYWARRRDGTLQNAYDYCLSLKAPSDDFVHAAEFLAEKARREGQAPRPLWGKIETRFSQESNTQPEIPCMQRWAERFAAVNDFRVLPIRGVIANWYHQGFFPTPVTELFGWLSYTDAPPAGELLRALARRDFGPGQEELVLAAWGDFSEAIWHFPFYFGLSYPMNAGYAQPFWLDPREVNTRPWRRGFVNDLKTANLADSGDGPGSGRENRARLARMQALWTRGLGKLQRAAAAAPEYVSTRAASNLRVAEAFWDKGDLTLRLVRWFDARSRLTAAGTPAESRAALDELERIGREELAAVRSALPRYLCDSRLGHLNHGRGCFTAQSILNKIDLLERTLTKEIPSRRAALE